RSFQGLCHPLYRAADGHVQIRVTFLQDKSSGRNDFDPDSAGLVTAAPRAIQIGDADPHTPDLAPIAVKSKAQAPLGVFLYEHWNICISYSKLTSHSLLLTRLSVPDGIALPPALVVSIPLI